jgi:integrase
MDDELSTLIERRWIAREWHGSRGETYLSPYVFHRLGVPRPNCNKIWRKACVRAGYPNKLLHDFRRTAVRDLVRGGVPESVAMTVTGHKTRSVFQRHNITTREDKLEALRRRHSYVEARSERPTVVKMRAANSDKDSDR